MGEYWRCKGRVSLLFICKNVFHNFSDGFLGGRNEEKSVNTMRMVLNMFLISRNAGIPV